MAKNLSEVFKEAKEYLWDGTKGTEVYPLTEFICHTISRTKSPTSLCWEAKDIILSRLGEGNWNVQEYLVSVGVPHLVAYGEQKKVQKFRRDWLTSLEKEFKSK